MNSSIFRDWRRIGRRLGKKLRDGLNSHPVAPGLSPEERRAQRLRDGFKGFVYFDTFEELETWQPQDVDPIQQPNQPLLIRSSGNVHNEDGPKTKLLLCHDYQGGYHDYEGVRPDLVDSEMYSCRHLQYVDSFIYFSHKLVCVPPPTWTNCLHRSGVKSLGTLLIEPQTLDIRRLLTRTDGIFTVAKQLADITNTYGFDGWLVNVEQDAPEVDKDWSDLLVDFISQLREFVGDQKEVIWYDALTIDGYVDYQNGLTPSNRRYAKAADGLFTNYKWTDKKLAQSKLAAMEAAIPDGNILFGIDLWAQNTNIRGPSRVTYPPKGGGGTNTGLAMKVLSKDGFSAVAFAPAWTFEHFPTSSTSCGSERMPSVAHRVDDSVWAGASLPDELFCGCRIGKPHHTEYYTDNPIIRFAQEYPVGSSTFFETAFNHAFWQKSYTNQLSPALSSQDPLPNLIPLSIRDWEKIHQGPMTRVLYGKLNSTPQVADHGPSLSIFTKLAGCWEEGGDQPVNYNTMQKTLQRNVYHLCLYKLNMPADGSLKATIKIRKRHDNAEIRNGFYVAYREPGGPSLEYRYHATNPTTHGLGPFVDFFIQNSNKQLVELGVFLEGDPDQSQAIALLDIGSIVIKPWTETEHRNLETAFTLQDIHLVDVVRENQVEKRITWRWATTPGQQERVWPVGMPWSQTTGPFSSFTVHVGGSRVIVEAFCTQCSLKPEEIEDLDERVDTQVVGNLFGGGHVRSARFFAHRADFMNDAKEK